MSSTDRAFLHAAFVFGGGNEPGLSVFTEPNRSRYQRLLETRGQAPDRATLLSRLRAIHEAQKRADLTKIHPSWVVRALQAEPSPVQLRVVSQLPVSIRETVAAELALSQEQINPSKDVESVYHSVALLQAMSRLVGDQAVSEEDTPAILALTALEPSAAPKMIRRMGMLKWSATSIPFPETDRIEFDRLRPWIDSLEPWDSRFLNVCEAELSRLKPLDTRALNRLGLATFSRLLTPADPHRVRWTLQQLSYSTAKTLRSRMGDSAPDFPLILSEESRLFKATWTALFEEGATKRPWPSETLR